MLKKKQVLDKIKNSNNLPSLPQVLLKLIEISNDDGSSAADLAEAISHDPSISTKVMRLVNSAYTGAGRRFKGIEQAVVYLGLDTINNIAISTSVYQVFGRTRESSLFKLSRFWWHSFMCASLARIIAHKTSYEFPEEAFLTGLLHDIGRLLLWVNFPKEFASVLQNHDDSSTIISAEERVFGANHAEVGAWLIKEWNLKTFMSDAVLYHHEPLERIHDAFTLVKIIYLAGIICRALNDNTGAGFIAARELFGFEQSQTEELISEAGAATAGVAQSLGIDLEPPSGGTGPESAKALEKHKKLLSEVNDIALLSGTLQNLLRAETEDVILKAVEHGLQILFNVNKIFFFLYQFEDDSMVAYSADQKSTDMPGKLVIPFKRSSGLIVMSLATRKPSDSFGLLTKTSLTIADKQIIGLLDTEGILCIPMLAHAKHIGVIVIGLSESDCRSLSKRLNILGMLANHAAISLHLYNVKQEHAAAIQGGRLEAAAMVVRKIVHEVNNPLSIIKNYIKVVDLKLPAEHFARDELKIMEEEVDRIGQLIHQLSDFSKPVKRLFERLNINKIIWDLLKVLKKSILLPAKINVHFTPDSSLHEIVTEKNGLKQVMINLLKNSTEAMPKGGNIYIETAPLVDKTKHLDGKPLKSSEKVIITVADDGPGIPDEIMARLFEPCNTSKGEGHSGLGLSIVKSIINELKGQITCESKQGEGTRFMIILPPGNNTKKHKDNTA